MFKANTEVIPDLQNEDRCIPTVKSFISKTGQYDVYFSVHDYVLIKLSHDLFL